jgi:hypothetical protein
MYKINSARQPRRGGTRVWRLGVGLSTLLYFKYFIVACDTELIGEADGVNTEQ